MKRCVYLASFTRHSRATIFCDKTKASLGSRPSPETRRRANEMCCATASFCSNAHVIEVRDRIQPMVLLLTMRYAINHSHSPASSANAIIRTMAVGCNSFVPSRVARWTNEKADSAPFREYSLHQVIP